MTLAVTEAVTPNPCCFGTLDKDWANFRAGTMPHRQRDAAETIQWQHSCLGDSKQLASLNFKKNNSCFRKCCSLLGSGWCYTLNKLEIGRGIVI